MILHLPIYISLIFALTTVATLLLFMWTIKHSSPPAPILNPINIFICLMIWLVIQAILTLNNVYTSDTNSIPPIILRFGILPTILLIVILFATQTGRRFIDGLPLKNLTYLNIVRVPVEIVLYWLYLNKAVPEGMTFEGQNVDILAGITAPFVAYFAFTKGKVSQPMVLLWNFICLVLLLNIVVRAFLSTPSPLQKLAFDQPNIAILNFPFSWLPTFIVPIVLFGHLVSIRQLLKRKKNY